MNEATKSADANALMVRRVAGLIEAELDGEMVALHIENGTCYAFNTTAAQIWRIIEQPQSLAQICDALAADFEVEPAECEADVRALLDDLASDGLVQLSAG